MSLKKLSTLFAILFFLSGCITVEDLGESWDNAIIDQEIDGIWFKEGTSLVTSFVEKDGYYITPKKDGVTTLKSPKIRTILLGKHKFLIMKKPAGNVLFLYTVRKDIFTLYVPNPHMKMKFKSNYYNPHVKFENNAVIISKIDSSVLKLMQELAGQSDYWKIISIMTRKQKSIRG